ncbi:S-layer protein [Methanocaldococcus fervens]|uniref:S-layer family protein n=1 Tax=Methanocaldococcus fervens (strain DSM 4213 / JCM 15782 / AG86) TaxID=573064 RepID=C7P7X9_METFA|nr:S-layer protein [Methanocaldococcus fervens]ACV24661.1 S-layer family protein [Methanocaldococcus fervens AG86]
MRGTLLLILLLVISVGYALPTEPIIIVNKSTADYENVKVLMDNLYSSREINVDEDCVTVNVKDIVYMPAVDELEIEDNDKKLDIEFDNNGGNIKYKDIYYIEYLNFEEGDEVTFFDKKYLVEDISSDYILLKEKDGEEIETNGSFEYDGYKVVVKLVSSDSKTIVVDIYENDNLVDSPKLDRDEFYHLEDGTLGIVYKNCTKSGNKYYFTFEVYSIIKIEEDEDYPLDKRFRVKDVSSERIKLEYKNVGNLEEEINLFNYTIMPEEIYDNYVLFKVVKKESKTLNMKNKDTAYLGDGIYAVKINDEIHVYYKGKELKNEKIYLNSMDAFDIASLNIDKDIILIGGPKVNKFVKELEDKGLLKVNVTNNYPGNNMGVIQKIKNPYNGNNIYVLAGSNRLGTKAAILAFLTKYNGEDVLKVEWKEGMVEVK